MQGHLNPRWSHLKVLILITSAETLLLKGRILRFQVNISFFGGGGGDNIRYTTPPQKKKQLVPVVYHRATKNPKLSNFK